MKKLVLPIITGIALILIASGSSFAQRSNLGSTYKTGFGIRIDAGDGSTGVGFDIKHFFSPNNAVNADLLFFDGDVVGLGAEYQYNAPIEGASGLQYYVGFGPQFLFGNNNTAVGLRPVAGLDFKIPNAPLDFAFDWRPIFYVTPDTDFLAARFGISLRYVIK